ncbi:MAG: hypothetical protein LBR21_09755 [Propionibacteriaceae bacterium]|jgi:hypothetical protein|nr:hypothetical protein [Propionibacteriaceae bacterium]
MNRALACLIAASGSLMAISAGATCAAYTDQANLNFSFGNPGFDIGIVDGSSYVQAESKGTAVVESVELAGGASSEVVLSKTTPVEFTTKVKVAPGFGASALYVGLWDPDDEGSSDVFNTLEFTVLVDGQTSALQSLSADEVNQAKQAVASDLKPGDTCEITVQALLTDAGKATSADDAKKGTAIGLKVTGESGK